LILGTFYRGLGQRYGPDKPLAECSLHRVAENRGISIVKTRSQLFPSRKSELVALISERAKPRQGNRSALFIRDEHAGSLRLSAF
jgi:hypothetical protein